MLVSFFLLSLTCFNGLLAAGVAPPGLAELDELDALDELDEPDALDGGTTSFRNFPRSFPAPP